MHFIEVLIALKHYPAPQIDSRSRSLVFVRKNYTENQYLVRISLMIIRLAFLSRKVNTNENHNFPTSQSLEGVRKSSAHQFRRKLLFLIDWAWFQIV